MIARGAIPMVARGENPMIALGGDPITARGLDAPGRSEYIQLLVLRAGLLVGRRLVPCVRLVEEGSFATTLELVRPPRFRPWGSYDGSRRASPG